MTQDLETILALFENGERRYDEDPAFKAVCDSLKMGLGVYAVLDHQIKEVERLRNTLKDKQDHINGLIHASEGDQDYMDMIKKENHDLKRQLETLKGIVGPEYTP
jgi:hypothetical protein